MTILLVASTFSIVLIILSTTSTLEPTLGFSHYATHLRRSLFWCQLLWFSAEQLEVSRQVSTGLVWKLNLVCCNAYIRGEIFILSCPFPSLQRLVIVIDVRLLWGDAWDWHVKSSRNFPDCVDFATNLARNSRRYVQFPAFLFTVPFCHRRGC